MLLQQHYVLQTQSQSVKVQTKKVLLHYQICKAHGSALDAANNNNTTEETSRDSTTSSSIQASKDSLSTSLQLLRVATATLANLLLPFSPCQHSLIENGAVDVFIELSKRDEPAIRLNAVWALVVCGVVSPFVKTSEVAD